MKENVTTEISFWKILLSVQLESFLWGFGTAIGELPPYYVARAAGNILLFFEFSLALAKKREYSIDEL